MNRSSAIGGPIAAEAAPLRFPWSTLAILRDLVALLKLRITALVIVTSVGGMWLAARLGAAPAPSLATAGVTLVGLCMVVGAANALNMYLERDSDALMARTKNRPLPAGRLQPVVALWLAWGLSVVALPLLAFVNMPTALLAAWAFALYAGFYTPFKRVTHHALLIGAVPGALPPLIGWTAVTGEIGLGGLLLFGVLFFWQVPHFLAIATLFADDYANAGLKVMPKTEPPRVVRVHALVHGVLLLVVSLGLVGSLGPRGGLGLGYGLSALLLGGAFLAVIAGDPGEEAEVTRRRRWARRVFFFSLIYLTALFAVIGVTGMLVTT